MTQSHTKINSKKKFRMHSRLKLFRRILVIENNIKKKSKEQILNKVKNFLINAISKTNNILLFRKE